MKNCFLNFENTNGELTSENFIKTIISGGQMGVDRAALDIAIKFKINIDGWCPYGRLAEDGIIPEKYKLKETLKPTDEENLYPDTVYKKRTELNARDSDGTLIIVKGPLMGGTLYTLEMLEKHNRPYFIFNLLEKKEIDDIVSWIIERNIQNLNVAGPRASQAAGIYESAYNLLFQLLNHKLLTKA